MRSGHGTGGVPVVCSVAFVLCQLDPEALELVRVLRQPAGLSIDESVAHPWHVEADRRRSDSAGLGDGNAPAFMARCMEEEPGLSKEPVLLLLVHPPDQLHLRSCRRSELVAARSIPDDYEASASDRPDVLPHSEQEVHPLVWHEASKSDEERLG